MKNLSEAYELYLNDAISESELVSILEEPYTKDLANFAKDKLTKASAKTGLPKTAIAVGGGIALFALFKKLSDPCVRKHLGNVNAQNECRLAAIRRVQQQIKANMASCGAAPNPSDCRSRFYNEYDKWETKAQSLLSKTSRD